MCVEPKRSVVSVVFGGLLGRPGLFLTRHLVVAQTSRAVVVVVPIVFGVVRIFGIVAVLILFPISILVLSIPIITIIDVRRAFVLLICAFLLFLLVLFGIHNLVLRFVVGPILRLIFLSLSIINLLFLFLLLILIIILILLLFDIHRVCPVLIIHRTRLVIHRTRLVVAILHGLIFHHGRSTGTLFIAIIIIMIKRSAQQQSQLLVTPHCMMRRIPNACIVLTDGFPA